MQEISIEELDNKLANGDSFVLNLVATWCPDCTAKQAPNLPDFAARLKQSDLPLHNLTVQQQKSVYLTEAHESLADSLGGHGFPRTVLYFKGQPVDTDNVEITGGHELKNLAARFAQIIKKPA